MLSRNPPSITTEVLQSAAIRRAKSWVRVEALIALMTHTPEEPETRADVGRVRRESFVDVGLLLAEFPSELLVILAETHGNPLALLVSKAHLSKGFCRAARNAQGLLRHIDLRGWQRTVDDAVVAAVVSKCSQLS